eukprot:3962977-Amphidinium_carterae.1
MFNAARRIRRVLILSLTSTRKRLQECSTGMRTAACSSMVALIKIWPIRSRRLTQGWLWIGGVTVAKYLFCRAGLKKLLDDRNAMPLSGRRSSLIA